jgi:hypothetical protein
MNFIFLNQGRGISLSSSESDDPSTGKSLSLAKKYSLIRRDLANLSRSADSCSSLILLGVGRVDMNKVDYLEEAIRQVTDERFYKTMDSDPTEEFSTRISQELKLMKENSHIDKNTFDYLKPDKPKAGRFYILPKTHQVNNPERPIVSETGHPTE